MKNAVKNNNDPDFKGIDFRAMLVHQNIAEEISMVADEWERGAGKTVRQMLKQGESAFKADKASFIKEVTYDMREWRDHLKAEPKLFGRRILKVEDLPPWEDEEGPKKLEFGADVPQDIRDFVEEQGREGTMMINTCDL